MEEKKTKKKISNRLFTLIIFVMFVLGLGLIAYPTIADTWNRYQVVKVIGNYQQTVSVLPEEDYHAYLDAAHAYNETLLEKVNPYGMSDENMAEYESLLNLDGTGMIGYLNIPTINVSIPVYHGTSEGVLQIAAGHLEWTSLPVGGESTHTVLSGHTGLPSAKLFTDLDKLVIGDTFQFMVLNEVITYEVDQILTVLPDEAEDLLIVEGEEYATLVTCTPYGVNSHRLLVRGHRVETPVEEEITVVNASTWQDRTLTFIYEHELAILLSVLGLMLCVFSYFLFRKKKS